MKTGKRATVFLLGLAIMWAPQLSWGLQDVCDTDYKTGETWLATGTVTKLDGFTFYFLGKDSNLYRIDAVEAKTFLEDEAVKGNVWAVGDTVRVFGTVTGSCEIKADRVRVFKRDDASPTGPGKEVKIIIEKRDGEPAVSGAGPAEEECSSAKVFTWRGLIADIDYRGRALKMRAPEGEYSVRIASAELVSGKQRVALGIFNIGDAVEVDGSVTGLGKIDAQQVRLTRGRDQAYNALPQTPVSLVGVIQQIDSVSQTFRMHSSVGNVVVLVGGNTWIQQHHDRMSFMDLVPGMRIKMTGNGSLGTGYAAKQIMIISVPLS